MLKKWLPLALGFCISSVCALAQPAMDTLRLSLPAAEKMFLDSNFQLLAQRYNVDATQALVIQARLWPNPNFQIGHTLYSGALHQWFPTGANDETTVGLSQVILLAGKRNKQIKLAQANVRLSQYQFFVLMRTLKYTLRTDFFQIYYLRKSALVYDTEIKALQQISTAFASQEGKGYISEKEVVRIKAQLYSFISEYNDLTNQINDTESELRLILQTKPTHFIDPDVDSNSISGLDPSKYALTTLIDSAYHNRTDLQIAHANTTINELQYKYQKALAVPDLSLNLGYDEAGSFLTSYYGIGAGIDLPFFNRNQGNIKQARIAIDQSNVQLQSQQSQVESDVATGYKSALRLEQLYSSFDPKFKDDFTHLIQEVYTNYQKRNLSMLEFLDFYDSYKTNTLQLNNLQLNRVISLEQLNYVTGTPFFNQQ